MTRVYFNLKLTFGRTTIGPYWLIINAIQELIYPGQFNVDKKTLSIAEKYFGTEAWFMISALGRNHRNPFYYNNGVVQTWSEYTSNQLRFIIASGAQWNHPHMLPLCG